MTLTKKTTLTTEGLDNLVQQFKSKENLEAFLTAFLDQCQDVENASFELIDERTLDAAVGAQLDGIGEIVGLDRGGLSDEDYRTRLRVQIRINKSDGTIDTLLGIVALLENDPLELTEYYPAAMEIFVIEIQSDPETLARIIADARWAGVGCDLHYTTDTLTNTFGFASGDTTESSSTEGFANDGGTTGGKFSDALEA